MPQNFKNNDFRLGMFGFLFRTTVKWDVWGIDPNLPHQPYLAYNGTMAKVKGIKYPSSQLNVLRSHGFNTVQRYFPGIYLTYDIIKPPPTTSPDQSKGLEFQVLISSASRKGR